MANWSAAWLGRRPVEDAARTRWRQHLGPVAAVGRHPAVAVAAAELERGLRDLMGPPDDRAPRILVGLVDDLRDGGVLPPGVAPPGPEGYAVRLGETPVVAGADSRGVVYGAFDLLRQLALGAVSDDGGWVGAPRVPLRMLDHWDNIDGSVERGYAGRSLFFRDGHVRLDERERLAAYARLLASVGINAIAPNNVNVTAAAARLVAPPLVDELAELAAIFRPWGIRLYLSVDFESPVKLDGLPHADPRDPAVRAFWARQAEALYARIPDLGGWLVKADSEFRRGPSAFGRTQADGANCLAAALAPWGGRVLWRTFAYPMQDWRDRTQDRAKAAYDLFHPLDGQFLDNVVLQTKHGPIDFQVREPVSPLLGAMPRTRQALELQITQEYTGQQRHLFYWGPAWQEVLATPVGPSGETVAASVGGTGVVGVANVGDDANWTGHDLAQANLYAFGRFAWDPEAEAAAVAGEWSRLTFGPGRAADTVATMLLRSAAVYEGIAAPLGVGFMVNPGHHYGPNPDGYEYSQWGTYHYADREGVGVDRTTATGTGFTAQYHEPLRSRYESLDTCPPELLLFFHHVPYRHRLADGRTLIQTIYDLRFDGAAGAEDLYRLWEGLEGQVAPELYERVRARLDQQRAHAVEWRDVLATYFFRKSGIADARGRPIVP